MSATCEPTEKRGWERRHHHVIFVADREGNVVQWWQDKDALFEGKCGRGPRKIKMSPYDLVRMTVTAVTRERAHLLIVVSKSTRLLDDRIRRLRCRPGCRC